MSCTLTPLSGCLIPHCPKSSHLAHSKHTSPDELIAPQTIVTLQKRIKAHKYLKDKWFFVPTCPQLRKLSCAMEVSAWIPREFELPLYTAGSMEVLPEGWCSHGPASRSREGHRVFLLRCLFPLFKSEWSYGKLCSYSPSIDSKGIGSVFREGWTCKRTKVLELWWVLVLL